MRAALVYPHQLFPDHPALNGAEICVIVEEPLLFRQYRFHAKKLAYHRAGMMGFADRVRRAGTAVRYVEAAEIAATGDIADILKSLAVTHVQFVDPNDDWLHQRLRDALQKRRIPYTMLDDPHFLTTDSEFADFAAGRSRLFFTEFYVRQRKRLGILVDAAGRPYGGKWSFDVQNRQRLPRSVAPPPVHWPPASRLDVEASNSVKAAFPRAIGAADGMNYPSTPEAATAALDDFLAHRFASFGAYEDAIHAEHGILFHSVLTPALNCGLLSPRTVVDRALEFGDRVPLNSLEGFVRQVIGWREFVRGVYRTMGRRQRSLNFWNHRAPMPAAFYDATTGIEPVDAVIRRVVRSAYCHHIERLMILGNFMLLCEIHPDAVYQWFMELFIDAYDWVMVPNVYGMSQHADGGIMTTKPYISGSAYVRRMSNFARGPWCDIWDGLYWRFIDRHREFFSANPRSRVLVSQLQRLGPRLDRHKQVADRFLSQLHGSSAKP